MKVLCFDLSASSGRFIVASFLEGKVATEEIFRFPNHPYEKDGHLYWDIKAIIKEMKEGIKRSFEEHPDIESIGIDTFGVDYLRLGKGSIILSDPFAYRDPRCQKAMESVLKTVPFESFYRHSGIQCLPFNTIFQLYDDKKKNRECEQILFLPDYLNFVLTGNKFTERTIASTGAILNLDRDLDIEMLHQLNIDPKIFSPFIDSSKKVGVLQENLAKELGVPEVPVFATASHDTASAIASIDLDDSSCYLVSGTWSLLGFETDKTIVSDASLKANFTNELGLQGSNRFLKNIMGLFIIQELYNEWKINDPSLSFGVLALEASKARELSIYIDVDDPIFSTPMDMEEKFYSYLKKTNQHALALKRGEIARIVYESMSFAYRYHYGTLSEIHGSPFSRVVVCGGGTKAEILNQFIADALQIKVETGQVEATVYGNALAQFLALDATLSWKGLREAMIPEERKTYLPKENKAKRYEEYLQIISGRN